MDPCSPPEIGVSPSWGRRTVLLSPKHMATAFSQVIRCVACSNPCCIPRKADFGLRNGSGRLAKHGSGDGRGLHFISELAARWAKLMPPPTPSEFLKCWGFLKSSSADKDLLLLPAWLRTIGVMPPPCMRSKRLNRLLDGRG